MKLTYFGLVTCLCFALVLAGFALDNVMAGPIVYVCGSPVVGCADLPCTLNQPGTCRWAPYPTYVNIYQVGYTYVPCGKVGTCLPRPFERLLHLLRRRVHPNRHRSLRECSVPILDSWLRLLAGSDRQRS